jgi:hypothetical protein
MTEMTNVSREGRITPGCAGMYLPEHVPAWRRIVEFVHRHSRARFGVQLGHAGRKGSTKLMWEGVDEPLPAGNWPLLSASALAYTPANQVPKAMDRGDMDLVKGQYVRATQMAIEAGFDLLELHMAHGYLLASFLSPLTNRREDGYGGAVDARLRYPLEVFDAVRAVWPADRPMSVRVSATDPPRGRALRAARKNGLGHPPQENLGLRRNGLRSVWRTPRRPRRPHLSPHRRRRPRLPRSTSRTPGRSRHPPRCLSNRVAASPRTGRRVRRARLLPAFAPPGARGTPRLGPRFR